MHTYSPWSALSAFGEATFGDSDVGRAQRSSTCRLLNSLKWGGGLRYYGVPYRGVLIIRGSYYLGVYLRTPFFVNAQIASEDDNKSAQLSDKRTGL